MKIITILLNDIVLSKLGIMLFDLLILANGHVCLTSHQSSVSRTVLHEAIESNIAF